MEILPKSDRLLGFVSIIGRPPMHANLMIGSQVFQIGIRKGMDPFNPFRAIHLPDGVEWAKRRIALIVGTVVAEIENVEFAIDSELDSVCFGTRVHLW